ncbi:MAG: metallophosphoesterase [Desulfohalobiaceae bacterium]|nr:metallophosphoesterase [Desulfohalobiaceae bacterium]
MLDQSDYQRIETRLGKDHLEKRLQNQVRRAAKLYTIGGLSFFHPKNAKRFHLLLKLFFQALGVFRRGQMNCLDYRPEEVPVALKRLPGAFREFRVLQLSDLHADGIPDTGVRLRNLLQGIECDLCVITGDFRFDTYSEYLAAMTTTKNIVSAVKATHGIFGVLGNHDYIEFVPELEKAGIQLLLNESIRIEKGGRSLLLAGVDDPHMYRLHDLKKALHDRRNGEISLLLSHTPEIYSQAEEAGVDYLLCGHTHGGQICLPGRKAIISNAFCPRRYCAGLWRYRNMWGYTSRGTGSSGLAVRYFCPPEITLHILS